MPITLEEIKAAKEEWGNRIVEISQTYLQIKDDQGETEARQKARLLATKLVTDLYAYDDGEQVFFRPTLATAPNEFRQTKEAAIEYFVPEQPEGKLGDHGFAIKGWTKVVFRPIGIAIRSEEVAEGAGWYDFYTANTDEPLQVHQAFVYKKIGGKVKVVSHMSFLPYQGE